MNELELQTAERIRLRGIMGRLRALQVAPATTGQLGGKGNEAILRWLKKWNKPVKLDYEYLSEIPSEGLKRMNDRLVEYYGLSEAP